MDDGLDEDAQVLSRLPGLVPLEADAQARRAGVVEGHLEHELLLPALRHEASQTAQLVLLGGTGRDGDGDERRVGTRGGE